jgi:hypothetical protein
MQLFSPDSIRYLLTRNGFESIAIDSFKNRYALRYWVRLLPLGARLKQYVIAALDAIGMADIKLGANVGNMLSFGYRPVSGTASAGSQASSRQK